MSEITNSETLAHSMLEIMPKLSRLMVVHITELTGNETTMMQIGVLHMMMHHRMTTSDLAKKRNVSLQAASTFVQGLVDRGWVVRVEDPNDRRRSILEVTKDGRAQAEALHFQMTQKLSEFMSDLTDEEIMAGQAFIAGLNRIVQSNLEEMCDENE